MPIDNDGNSHESDEEEKSEGDVWNPFWGPQELALEKEARDSGKLAEEQETRRNIEHNIQLKSGVMPIGASSEQFIPFPRVNDVIDQVHKILKKLIMYRENWKSGCVREIERIALQKEVILLVVSIDHFRKCSRSYLKPLDIIIELLSNTEKSLAPKGSGIILEGTLDVYNQELLKMMNTLEREGAVSITTRLLGTLGIILLIGFASCPQFHSWHLEIWGTVSLVASLLYHKLFLWKNYTTR